MVQATEAQPSEQSLRSMARARPWIAVLALVGSGLVLFLFLWRLDVYPAPWFDEGAYMNVARTLVEDGVYAERSSDGFRFNGAVISTGPTVILPIAGLFRLLGVSIVAGRLVMVGYGLLTLLMMYLLAQRLLPDWRYALTAVVLALLSWGNWMPLVFRTVLGEGPAVFYVLAALWLWFAPGRPSLGWLMVVGVLLGLACMTKAQFALILFPSLALAWLLDIFWYRQRGWHAFVVPGVVMALVFGAWLITAYFLLGQGVRNQGTDLATTGVTASLSYFTLDLASVAHNLLGMITGHAYGGLFLVGVVAGIVLSLPRTATGQRWSIVTILSLASTFFYLIVTGVAPDQNRMAIPMYLFGALTVARLIFELLDGYQIAWRGALCSARRGEFSLQVLRPVLVLGLALTLVILPMLRAGFNVLRSGSDAPYAVAAFLDGQAEDGALIETWDREMGTLTDHVYHFPPQAIQAYHNAHIANPALPTAGDLYDALDYVTPDYIIVGPMSRWAQLYPPALLADYDLVFVAGSSGDRYEVFARR